MCHDLIRPYDVHSAVSQVLFHLERFIVMTEIFNSIFTEPPKDENTDSKEKLSLSGLEQTFKDLNSHKIKDSLSSFLPHIPGEFDRPPDTTDTMLRHLLDQRTIGGKEFSPLSGQALLGFRLLPGPVSYR